MIAEPFIDLLSGELYSHIEGQKRPSIYFQQYADFERAKLKELKGDDIHMCEGGYTLFLPHKTYTSESLFGYNCGKYGDDSESNRLVIRTRFMKAVCEKEGVEWLPVSNDDECRCLAACWSPSCMSSRCRHYPTGRPIEGRCKQCKGESSPCVDCFARPWSTRDERTADEKRLYELLKGSRDYYTKAEVDEKLEERKPETVNVNVDTTELQRMLKQWSATIKNMKKKK